MWLSGPGNKLSNEALPASQLPKSNLLGRIDSERRCASIDDGLVMCG